MSIDLKPCPHCGSEAAFRVVSHQLLGGEHPLAGMEYIDCNNKLCGASTIAMYSTGEDCKPLLAERWNCRFGAAIKAAQPEYMCPNCVSPWKCNGPHIPEHTIKAAQPSPFPACKYAACDLPGQCKAEGKCHHPRETMLKDSLANGYTQEVSDMLWKPSAISDERIFELATELIGDKWPLENSPQPLIQFARALLSERPVSDETVRVPREWTPHGIKREGECVWMQDSDGAWNTSCQQTFEFAHDGPAENHAYFCYHCGGALLPEPYSDDAAAQEDK